MTQVISQVELNGDSARRPSYTAKWRQSRPRQRNSGVWGVSEGRQRSNPHGVRIHEFATLYIRIYFIVTKIVKE